MAFPAALNPGTEMSIIRDGTLSVKNCCILRPGSKYSGTGAGALDLEPLTAADCGVTVPAVCVLRVNIIRSSHLQVEVGCTAELWAESVLLNEFIRRVSL